MGFQSTIVQTNLPQFPWNIGDKLDAVPLNNAIIGLQQQIDNLFGQTAFLQSMLVNVNLGFSLTVNFGGNSSPTLGPYVLIGVTPYDFTLVSTTNSVGTAGGSFTYTLLDNNVPIEGLIDVLVDQSAPFQVMAAANTIITKGSHLSMVISAITGNPQNIWVTLTGTSNAVPEQIAGVGTGHAAGNSLAIAVGAGLFTGEAVFVASGNSSAIGFMIAAVKAVGTATGTSSASGVGVASFVGPSTAVAFGTSSTDFKGSTTSVSPTFVMDDPVVGILNQNPLG